MRWKSVLHGVARSFDLFGVSSSYSGAQYRQDSPEASAERDAQAIAQDWTAVGGDLWHGVKQLQPEVEARRHAR